MRKLIPASIILLLLGLVWFWLYPLYQQEGHLLPLASAAWELTNGSADIAAIPGETEEYLARSGDGIKPLLDMMASRGWNYQEQMGTGIMFVKNGALATVSSRMFTSRYIIFSIPEPDQQTVLADATTINLVATGDILMHNTVIASGLTSGGYNFDHLYAPIKHLLTAGDYASVNLECALAGPSSGYTGYPLFNSPDAIAPALKNVGFDLVVTANNHILDRGYQGALRTMDTLRAAGLDTTGTFKTLPERQEFLIKDLHGVKVGYLAYSYSTNGIPVPADKPYFYNFLNKEQMVSDITALRPQVDLLVVILHWGVEYSPFPTAAQRQMARELFEKGADVILGSHPHVIQPMEVMKINGQDKFVIYSMGNSMGNQNGVERNSGVVLNLQFSKDLTGGNTVLTGVTYTPTYIHPYYVGQKRTFRVVPIEETIAAIKAGTEPVLGPEAIPELEKVLDATNRTLNQPLD
ncbi:MAG: CapA family protein [Syntrophomonadaceae bacterium]